MIWFFLVGLILFFGFLLVKEGLKIRKQNELMESWFQSEVDKRDGDLVEMTKFLTVEQLKLKKPYIQDRMMLAHIFDLISTLTPDAKRFLATTMHDSHQLFDQDLPEEEILTQVYSGPYFMK